MKLERIEIDGQQLRRILVKRCGGETITAIAKQAGLPRPVLGWAISKNKISPCFLAKLCYFLNIDLCALVKNEDDKSFLLYLRDELPAHPCRRPLLCCNFCAWQERRRDSRDKAAAALYYVKNITEKQIPVNLLSKYFHLPGVAFTEAQYRRYAAHIVRYRQDIKKILQYYKPDKLINKKKLGQMLKTARQASKETLFGVHLATFLSESTIRAFERGERIPKDIYKVKLAKLYRIPLYKFFVD